MTNILKIQPFGLSPECYHNVKGVYPQAFSFCLISFNRDCDKITGEVIIEINTSVKGTIQETYKCKNFQTDGLF
jgi:hypothetical protein